MTHVTRVFTTDLWCSQCYAEREHMVLYAGPYIKQIQCVVCGKTFLKSAKYLRSSFVHDLPRRTRGIVSYGVRAFHHRPVAFMVHLPRALLLKSLELSAEVYAILDEQQAQ